MMNIYFSSSEILLIILANFIDRVILNKSAGDKAE